MIPIPVLKTAVIVMGVLIVAGLVVIIIKISQKSGELAERMATADTDASAESAPAPAARQESGGAFAVDFEKLGFGNDARLVSMDVAGEKVVLRVEDGAGKERVVIVDINSGAVTGNIALPPAEK
jgi:hypothetical protein